MDSRLDWKFFLTLAITIAGAAIPLWLWQSDLSSKAILLTVKSTAELQPKGIDALDGVQLSVDGKPLESPYVSVIEVSNSGSRPIASADFEGPIRIYPDGPSRLVKVRKASSIPLSLEPTVTLSDGVISIRPLLLNPGDTIRITTVAANARPVFTAQARIAGVPEININDAQTNRETKRYWLAKVVSILLLTLYIINVSEFAVTAMRRRTLLLRPLATGVVSAFGAALLLAVQSPENAASPSNFLPVMGIAVLLSFPVILQRMRRGVA